MNLYAMLADSIRRHAGKVAVSHGDRTLTYAELDRVASDTAAFLLAAFGRF